MTMQHLHSPFTVCEMTMQHLHSPFTACEMTMQHLRGPFTVCSVTMQHLHSLFTGCETIMQHLHFQKRFGRREAFGDALYWPFSYIELRGTPVYSPLCV